MEHKYIMEPKYKLGTHVIFKKYGYEIPGHVVDYPELITINGKEEYIYSVYCGYDCNKDKIKISFLKLLEHQIISTFA